jgi:3-oxoacyl-[acyl-carrier-protein] synthase-1
MNPLAISHYTVTTACGQGKQMLLDSLRRGASGLRARRFESCTLDCWVGVVDGLDEPLSSAHSAWDCRNTRLLNLTVRQDGFLTAVEALRRRYGASRVGLFLGTSTSGIRQGERAYEHREGNGSLPSWFDYQRTQSIHATTELARRVFGLSGCTLTISTACSSSAKVFAAAARAIQSGVCDAAVVGGVDSLCLTTLHGFNALQLISPEICRPADVRRKGISIGEAGGFAIIDPQAIGGLALLGYGESTDAHHMSAPDPEGRGAMQAMRGALARAEVPAGDVDYINLHGTGTAANDLAEDRAVLGVFGTATACSSTKGWTGHALGAAGIVEAAIALLCIEEGFMPMSLNTHERDPQLRAGILAESREAKVQCVLSNSFGFGGSNCSLLFGRAP